MDSGAVWTLVTVYLIITGEACIPEGLLNQEELEAVQQGDMGPAESDRQWIFPSLQFTCTINLTGWIFITNTSADVVCPTVQLWNNFTATSTTTDFLRAVSLTPDDFSDPTSLSQFVYRCTLNTPIVVNAGTVVGYITRSPGGTEPESSVMLLQSGDLVGYSRNILSAATIFNIATAQTLSGETPLITPTTAETKNQPLHTTEGNEMLSHSSATRIVPSVTSTTLAPNMSSVNMCGNNGTGESNGAVETALDSASTLVIITTTLLSLVITANVVVFLICLTKRRKRKKQSSALVEDSRNTETPFPDPQDDDSVYAYPQLQSHSGISTSSNEAYALYRGMTVRENPAYWKQLQGRPREMRRSLSWNESYAYIRH